MSSRSWSLVGVVWVALVVAGCAVEVASVDPPPTRPTPAPVPSTLTTTTTLATTTTTRPPSPYLARLPVFPAPPAPVPMVLPDGPAPELSRIDTDQPVAFITIDDGFNRHPEALQLVRDSGVPVTLFLISRAAAQDPAWFGALRDQAGASIQAHSVSHVQLRGRSPEVQRREICGSADQLQQLFGIRPTLFRAPFGAKDATTQQIAKECGFKAVLFWKQFVADGQVQFQQGSVVRPGDIVLMHFSPNFVNDFLALLDVIHRSGLTPARLEDYLR